MNGAGQNFGAVKLSVWLTLCLTQQSEVKQIFLVDSGWAVKLVQQASPGQLGNKALFSLFLLKPELFKLELFLQEPSPVRAYLVTSASQFSAAKLSPPLPFLSQELHTS